MKKSKIFLWFIWLFYVLYLLFSDFPPGNSLLKISHETLKEVINLSLNFWFISPLFSPDSAPVLNPILEGIFNLVVTWALLFWCFYLDNRGQKYPMSFFLIGTAFLTNVFYLPWLAIRESVTKFDNQTLSLGEKIAESRWLPSLLLIIAIASCGWAIWARGEFGDLSSRWLDFQEILSHDRLAYSFIIDLLFFFIFQSWLVADDMARREWHNPTMLWITRLIPFVGLIIYFWFRPRISIPIKEEKEN